MLQLWEEGTLGQRVQGRGLEVPLSFNNFQPEVLPVRKEGPPQEGLQRQQEPQRKQVPFPQERQAKEQKQKPGEA